MTRSTSNSATREAPGTVGVSLLGTYPSTRCGIATFTRALRDALAALDGVDADVVRVVAHDEPGWPDDPGEPAGVAVQWRQGDDGGLHEALAVVAGRDAVVVQHEFGIYGGRDGDEVVEFLEGCPVPKIVVLHTALAAPSHHQRYVLDAIADRADALVVQSFAARDRIADTITDLGGVPLVVIPHGAALNLVGASARLAPSPVVLTWGLIGPGKGIEHGITALAALGDLVPRPTYLVVGGTHPKVLEREGEAYRSRLMSLACALGVRDQVVFANKYRTTSDLQALVRGADIVLLPYDSPEQVTSGVLVEAQAAGKPVVATAFPHAVEALADGSGLVVPRGDATAIAGALRSILLHPGQADAMRRAARDAALGLAWPTVAGRYAELARQLVGRRLAA